MSMITTRQVDSEVSIYLDNICLLSICKVYDSNILKLHTTSDNGSLMAIIHEFCRIKTEELRSGLSTYIPNISNNKLVNSLTNSTIYVGEPILFNNVEYAIRLTLNLSEQNTITYELALAENVSPTEDLKLFKPIFSLTRLKPYYCELTNMVEAASAKEIAVIDVFGNML